jgi:hypothetical protein
MVAEVRAGYGSPWSAIEAVAAKLGIGCVLSRSWHRLGLAHAEFELVNVTGLDLSQQWDRRVLAEP